MNQIYTFDNLPHNAEELAALREGHTTDPHYIAALTVLALTEYPDDPEAAIGMLNLLKGPQELSAYEKQFLKDRFRDKSYLMRSYFLGSSPKNNYQPAEPYQIEIREQSLPDEENYKTLWLQSSGADSIRPLKLRLKPSTGEWFLWEQMLLAGIRMPEAEDPWA